MTLVITVMCKVLCCEWLTEAKFKFLISVVGTSCKSLARHTSPCILIDGENISFDASLVVYINSTNISPIMIVNRIYDTENLLSL